jgi:hypothetical protein
VRWANLVRIGYQASLGRALGSDLGRLSAGSRFLREGNRTENVDFAAGMRFALCSQTGNQLEFGIGKADFNNRATAPARGNFKWPTKPISHPLDEVKTDPVTALA